MLSTIKAVVNNGRIELLENVEMPDGTRVLVTVLPNDDDSWLNASERSLRAVWNNSEDDVYAELLER